MAANNHNDVFLEILEAAHKKGLKIRLADNRGRIEVTTQTGTVLQTSGKKLTQRQSLLNWLQQYTTDIQKNDWVF